jgi:hypothetical protein
MDRHSRRLLEKWALGTVWLLTARAYRHATGRQGHLR